jgi:tetratricopeptide (TPR) repeat protein
VNTPVRTFAAVAAATALTVSVLAASTLALPATANASTFGGTTPFRPTDPGFVVAELPGRPSRARDGSARQLELSRSDPQLAAQLAAALLDQARTSAQPQLYGRAESVLAPWIARPTVPAPLLILEANILQQRHEFGAALELLDRAIGQEPRSSQARLMRANVHIVTGDYERARPDCAWLLGAGEQWTGSVCIAQVLGSTGQLEHARTLLERLMGGEAAGPSGQGQLGQGQLGQGQLGQGQFGQGQFGQGQFGQGPTAEVLAWTLSVRADLALRAGALPEAQAMLTQAVALAPASDYTRLALADVLIASNQFAPAVKVLDTSRPSVGVLLRRAIAQSRNHAGHAPESLEELEERLNVSAQRGERTHLREEARLALEFPHEGADGRHAALALARDNFNVQRETEDIRLFARAVVAARDPAALATLNEWLQHSHYEDIVIDQLLRSGHSS